MYNTVGSLRGPMRIFQGHNCKYQHAHVGGAIIASQSNVTIIRSDFIGNGAEIGGAIFAMHGSDIAILNSRFVGNSAANCSNAQVRFGGVVYAENAYSGSQETQLSVMKVSLVTIWQQKYT